MKKFNFIKTIVYLFCSSVFTSANAAILSFDYTGTIINSPDAIVSVGTSFSGSFSYDDGLIGSVSTSGTLYNPAEFSLSIDGANINFTGAINVDNNSTIGLPGNDYVEIGRFFLDSYPILNGSALESISITLADSSQSILSNENLPITFDLTDWSSELLAFRSLTTSNITFGRIDTLTPTIPIPAAVWLFSSGLIGLIGIARRKKT